MRYVLLLAFLAIGSVAFAQKDSVSEEVFTKVDVEAVYSGNWRQFLVKNLDAAVPLKNKAKAGQYTVIVQFIVDKEGNISDIKALTSHGYGMEEEVLRVVRKSGKWMPAIQNGLHVKAYKKQPVTFVIADK